MGDPVQAELAHRLAGEPNRAGVLRDALLEYYARRPVTVMQALEAVYSELAEIRAALDRAGVH